MEVFHTIVAKPDWKVTGDALVVPELVPQRVCLGPVAVSASYRVRQSELEYRLIDSNDIDRFLAFPDSSFPALIVLEHDCCRKYVPDVALASTNDPTGDERTSVLSSY